MESSLPKNWPQSTKVDLDAKPERIVHIGSQQEYSFCNNSIRTVEYEWQPFPVKFLMEEFNPRKKFANCYFMIIGCVFQHFGLMGNTSDCPRVQIALYIVLLLTGVYKALEDSARHKADTKANSSITEVFDRNTKVFRKISWAAVQVGDILKVYSQQVVPADLVILEVNIPLSHL